MSQIHFDCSNSKDIHQDDFQRVKITNEKEKNTLLLALLYYGLKAIQVKYDINENKKVN